MARFYGPWCRTPTPDKAESFKAELRICHRAKSESLQDLYRDTTRLIQLAYPGVDNVLVTHVGIESFIAAFNDPKLEYEVRKREPPSLEAGASYAVKLEAYAHSLSTHAAVSAEPGGGHAQSRPRSDFAVTDEQEDDADDKATLVQCIAH